MPDLVYRVVVKPVWAFYYCLPHVLRRLNLLLLCLNVTLWKEDCRYSARSLQTLRNSVKPHLRVSSNDWYALVFYHSSVLMSQLTLMSSSVFQWTNLCMENKLSAWKILKLFPHPYCMLKVSCRVSILSISDKSLQKLYRSGISGVYLTNAYRPKYLWYICLGHPTVLGLQCTKLFNRSLKAIWEKYLISTSSCNVLWTLLDFMTSVCIISLLLYACSNQHSKGTHLSSARLQLQPCYDYNLKFSR